MRAQRSHGAYTTDLPIYQQTRPVVPRDGAQTHFPDSQDNVPLQGKGNRLWVGTNSGF
jgi:hypothetical protein